MSQGQPRLPEEPHKPSQPAASSTAAGQHRAAPKGSVRSLQHRWQQVQPAVKSRSIKFLQTTIQVLQKVVVRLEAKPAKQHHPKLVQPSSKAQAMQKPGGEDSLLDDPWAASMEEPTHPPATGSRLGQEGGTPVSIQQPPPARKKAGTPLPSRPPQSTLAKKLGSPASLRESPTAAAARFVIHLMEKSRPRWERLQTWLQPRWERLKVAWNLGLGKIRTLLPEAWNTAISNQALSGIVAGILVLLLWIILHLASGKPAPVPQVSPTPRAIASPTSSPMPQNLPISQPESIVTPELPRTGKTTRPAKLNLTPEQRLIASIQEHAAQVTEQYSKGLIQSVQANFRDSLLTVKVGDDWYDLSRDRQDKLADDLLKRSRTLDFNRLELTNLDGTLLARSPVIGDSMVVVKRNLTLFP